MSKAPIQLSASEDWKRFEKEKYYLTYLPRRKITCWETSSLSTISALQVNVIWLKRAFIEVREKRWLLQDLKIIELKRRAVRYRPGVAWRVTGLEWPRGLQAWSGPEGSRKLRFPDFMTTAQDNGKVVSLTNRPPLPPKIHLVLISDRSRVDPRAIVWPEGLCHWKIPMTSPGIEPATCRLKTIEYSLYIKVRMSLSICSYIGRCRRVQLRRFWCPSWSRICKTNAVSFYPRFICRARRILRWVRRVGLL